MLGMLTEYMNIIGISFTMCWLSIGFTYFLLPYGYHDKQLKLLQYIPGLLHSIVVCPPTLYFYYTEEAAELQHNIYGFSTLLQYIFSISFGFFLYDIVLGIIMNKRIFIIHGTVCCIGTAIILYPFAQYFCAPLILYELSSISYNIRMIMIHTNNGYGNLFYFIEATFALTFIFIRIFIGIPFTLINTPIVLDIIYNGDLHSKLYSIIVFCVGYTLIGLNCYWARDITNRILSKIRYIF